MSHKIDKLFKAKLAERIQDPSPTAWTKLQSQLGNQKKRKAILYYRIAAVFLLLTVSTIALISLDLKEPLSHSAEKVLPNSDIPVEEFPKEAAPESYFSQNEPKTANTEDPVPLTKKTSVAKRMSEEKLTSDSKTTEGKGDTSINKPSEIVRQTPNLLEESNPDIEALLTQLEPAILENDESQDVHQTISIVYKKGKKSNDALIVTVPVENEGSAIKRLIKMVREIKISDINLAELRDSKEDLLDLEIGKKKLN